MQVTVPSIHSQAGRHVMNRQMEFPGNHHPARVGHAALKMPLQSWQAALHCILENHFLDLKDSFRYDDQRSTIEYA